MRRAPKIALATGVILLVASTAIRSGNRSSRLHSASLGYRTRSPSVGQ